ncbi:unnamed protein product [Closterium sp. NIES-64]|nr:unnamed protein product [Closterium sp. NIES-64]
MVHDDVSRCMGPSMLPTLNAAGGVVLLEHITPALHALKPHLLSFHHHLPFSSAWCMGPSMLPTLNAAGDVVLLEHITPALHALKPGDIVVAKSPSNPRMMVCKRVVAMEGHEFPSNPRMMVCKRVVAMEGSEVHAMPPATRGFMVAKSPSNPRMMVCKRVVAMEGSEVHAMPPATRGFMGGRGKHAETHTVFPSNPRMMVCKRVVAMEGSEVHAMPSPPRGMVIGGRGKHAETHAVVSVAAVVSPTLPPSNPRMMVCKRIVALEGHEVHAMPPPAARGFMGGSGGGRHAETHTVVSMAAIGVIMM